MSQPISAAEDVHINSLTENIKIKKDIDTAIRVDYKAIKPSLERAGTVCRTHMEIGIDLNRGQLTARRLLDPDQKPKTRGVTKSFAGGPGNDAVPESRQSAGSDPASDESQQGRTIKFQQSMTTDEYAEFLPDEFVMYFPTEDGAPDPRGIASLRELISRLQISAADLGYSQE